MDKNVLIVDDDAKIRRSLSRAFEDEGFEVDVAISSAEARVLLDRNDFDAIICDNQMPGLNGTRFLAEISKTFPDVKRFMLTGDITNTEAFLVDKEIGVCALLEKPCSSEKLLAAVKTAFGQ